MRFYYISILSWMVYAAVAFIAIVLLWILWTRLFKLQTKNPVYWVLVAAVLLGPWVEELWIAYNFDRLCRKDAGVSIRKTVEVEGFYDHTSGWGARQVSQSQYLFMESRDILTDRLLRVERADDSARDSALRWYSERNPGIERSKDVFLVRQVGDREQIVVVPDGLTAWRVNVIDKPTARYHYTAHWSGEAIPVAHKIKREDASVVDTHTGEVLAMYVGYARDPYWFFISAGAPTVACEETKGKHSLIYRDALKPKS
jgi:hypothetical protein